MITVLIHNQQPAPLVFECARVSRPPWFQHSFVQKLLDGYLGRACCRWVCEVGHVNDATVAVRKVGLVCQPPALREERSMSAWCLLVHERGKGA